MLVLELQALKWINRPIQRCLFPLFQNESWCTAFHVEMSFTCHSLSCKSNQFSHERLCTRTRFETEDKCNSSLTGTAFARERTGRGLLFPFCDWSVSVSCSRNYVFYYIVVTSWCHVQHAQCAMQNMGIILNYELQLVIAYYIIFTILIQQDLIHIFYLSHYYFMSK